MGLDTTHDCWHGPYSHFNSWREAICRAAGYGDLRLRQGFDGNVAWPDNDPIVKLLNHSDCEGQINADDCFPIAKRLSELLDLLPPVDAKLTHRFIAGLYDAGANHEAVIFQ